MNCCCEEFESTYSVCTFCSQNQLIPLKEYGRTYILKNVSRRKICKIRVDGCVIGSHAQAKCDYLIIVCKSINSSVLDNHFEDLYLIELKGRDFLKAVEQLHQTLKYFEAGIGRSNRVFARAVLSKVHAPRTIETDPSVLKLRKLLKSYKGDFLYASQKYDRDQV